MAEDELDDIDLDDDDNLEQTYLTFAVGAEEYAIPVAHVTEIVRLQKIFSVPDVARHVRGVINLRGKVIPLLDVRARFGLPETVYNDRTVIVVIEVAGAPTGLVVDAVYDITELPPDSIEASPALTRATTAPMVTGMCKRGDRVSFVIAVERLIAHDAVVAPASNDQNLQTSPTA
jgi:purine-binding chemotaxis protein CheW